jgi:hypothetical protein
MPMHPNCEEPAVRLILSLALAVVLASGCGGRTPADSGSATPADTTAPGGAPPPASAPAAPAGAPDPTASLPASPGLAGRSGELINPEASQVVFLYYDLAGIEPPIQQWVDKDNRVQFAQAFDKEAKRTEVRAELESTAAAVAGIGNIRLTMNADLSDYDRTYGEFTVRSLAPSSMVPFDALGQRVVLKFGNGRTAQLWKVPEAEAQLVRDKIGPYGQVSLDVLLQITGVQPAPGGGTIMTDVVEYEMRENRTGLTIGRVKFGQ